LVGGTAILLARPALVAGPAPTVALAAGYVSIGAAALAMPVARSPATVSAFPTFVLGVGAVVAVLWLVGPGVPLRLGWSGLPVGAFAAVAEEALFRRLLYDRLAGAGAVAAVVGSAVAFALLHVPLYGVEVLPVDLGAGLLFSWQRWASGSWAVPAATHVAAQLLMGMR
jgi:membrane protease YdiL (CAAX protease family)